MEKKKVGLLHGAGYAGGELIRLLATHTGMELILATSRTFANQSVWRAHPALRGQTDLVFTDDEAFDPDGLDGLFITAEHGKGVEAVIAIQKKGFEGAIVDLSADFRFQDAATYDAWFHFTHPRPEWLKDFVYGLPELNSPYPSDARRLANPGCFATGLTLALWPVARQGQSFKALVTALTGASGSGTQAKATTHFPTREGNVSAYKVLAHQHLPEVQQSLGPLADISFVPVSGPWTRGIWGTAHIVLANPPSEEQVGAWFDEAYRNAPTVRLWPGQLPQMRYAVGTPFCDIGWVVQANQLVLGFALDNLLKGASSQAIQNMNLLLNLPETMGLLIKS